MAVTSEVQVSSDAGSLVVTCRNVTFLDVALTVTLLAAGLATVCTIVACIHIFFRFALWDGSPAIVLHLGWTVGGAFMIILAVHAILRLIPHILHLIKTVISDSGDVLRIDAVSWRLVCHKPEKGRVGLAGLWWPPTKVVHTGATSALKGALVLSEVEQKTACLILVSHATPFEFGQELPRQDLSVASDAVNSFLLQLGLSATPPVPPVCTDEATQAMSHLLLPMLWYTPSPEYTLLQELRAAGVQANAIVAAPTDDGSSFTTQVVPYTEHRSIRFNQRSTANPDQLLTGLPAADVLTIVRPPLWLLVYCTAMLAVLLGGWACWGLSSVEAAGSGMAHLVTAAASLLCAASVFVFSTEKVLMIDNEEWCMWKAVSWLPVEWTSNPQRGLTCELVGAMVSADISVYDTCNASYKSGTQREQSHVFQAPLDPAGDTDTPLGELSRLIPSHPAFAASPSVVLRRRVGDTVESVSCFSGADDFLACADSVYAVFRINAHLSSLRGDDLGRQ